MSLMSGLKRLVGRRGPEETPPDPFDESKDAKDGPRDAAAAREPVPSSSGTLAKSQGRSWLPFRSSQNEKLKQAVVKNESRYASRRASEGQKRNNMSHVSVDSLKRRLSGANDAVELELLCRMQGMGRVVEVLQGVWMTKKGTRVVISGHTAFFTYTNSQKYEKELEIKGDELVLVGSSLDLMQSNAYTLTWRDGDVWTRGADTEDQMGSSYVEEWVVTSGSNDETPKLYDVQCEDQPELTGIYTLVDTSHNALPVWGSQCQRLYSDGCGYWMFSNVARMVEGVGMVSSAEPHMGRLPDTIKRWEYFGGVDGDVDGWVPCNITVRRRTDYRPSPVPSYSRSDEGLGDRSITPLSVRFCFEAFLRVHDPDQPVTVVKELTNRVNKGMALDTLLGAMAVKYEAPPEEWKGFPVPGVLRYHLESFYNCYAPRHLNKVDGLVSGIISRRYTLEAVLTKLCDRWEGKGASMKDWSGDFPKALRTERESDIRDEMSQVCVSHTWHRKSASSIGDDGIDLEATFPQSSQSDGIAQRERSGGWVVVGDEEGDEVVINKDPSERLGLEWTDETLLCNVQPGGVGERHGLQDFVGRRLGRIDGKAISRRAQIVTAVSGSTQLKLFFLKDSSQSPTEGAIPKAPAAGPTVPPADPSLPSDKGILDTSEAYVQSSLTSRGSDHIARALKRFTEAALSLSDVRAEGQDPPVDMVQELESAASHLAGTLGTMKQGGESNLVGLASSRLAEYKSALAQTSSIVERYLSLQEGLDALDDQLYKNKRNLNRSPGNSALQEEREQLEKEISELKASMARLLAELRDQPYHTTKAAEILSDSSPS